jgi:hypothetical protein
MEQPIRYELLLQAAECLERAREAEQQGNLEKGQALRAEAQTLLERSRKGFGPKRIAGNVQHLAIPFGLSLDR